MRKSFEIKDFAPIMEQLKSKSLDFTVLKTKYSRRIKVNKKQLIFSDTPMNSAELKIINKIREKADVFDYQKKSKKNKEISFSKFYDINENQEIKGVKIDLNSAYWQTAINIGLIDKDILDFFDKFFKDLDIKEQKKVKLRTLGSLATKTTIETFKNGKLSKTRLEFFNNRREIYMHICEVVADTMLNLAYEFNEHVIFHYWDCLFLANDVDIEEVKEKINNLGYKSKIEGKGKFEITRGVLPKIKFTDSKSKESKVYNISKDDLIE